MSEPAVVMRGLEKSFAPFQLGPLDLEVPSGAIYGLLGPNGAGKTTTFDLIMGMGKPDAGSIEVFGLDHRRDEVAVKAQTGYASPDLNFTAWGRVNKCLSFFRAFFPDWDDAYCLSLLDRFKLGWNDKIGTLSFGARTKLGLVIALSHRPRLLLLDEPLAGLDALSKRQVFEELLEAVQDERRTVLLSSHNLDEIERFADHIAILNEGKLLLEGPTAQLIERYQLIDCELPERFPTALDGAWLQRQQGTHRRYLVDTTHPSLATLTQAADGTCRQTPVTLEEIFVGVLGGTDRRQREMVDAK